MSVSDYFDERAPADAKKKYKTLAAKRTWCTKVARLESLSSLTHSVIQTHLEAIDW